MADNEFKEISSVEEFDNEVLNSDKIVLVDFYAEWCGPCRMVAGMLPKVKEKFNDSIDIVKVDSEKNPESVSAYSVRSLPTLLIIKDKAVVKRLDGSTGFTDIVNAIEEVI
ncbi:MAG: thioredoxin [Phenylobacterium sp.]